MTVRIERTTNTNDEALIKDAIAVTSTSSVTLLSANMRCYIAITALKKNIWLKLQSANIDDDMKGIFVARGLTYEFHPDIIYTGEISAIAETGTAQVYVTEF